MMNRKKNNSLMDAIKKHAVVIMMEIPADNYIEKNTESILTLTQGNYIGIYISFQRPFKNIYSLFQQNGVDINKLYFIDVATSVAGEVNENNPRCFHISSAIDVDELVRQSIPP